MRQALYRVHGEDSLGSFTIDCYSCAEYIQALDNIRNSEDGEIIWTEEWDEEEGWQA